VNVCCPNEFAVRKEPIGNRLALKRAIDNVEWYEMARCRERNVVAGKKSDHARRQGTLGGSVNVLAIEQSRCGDVESVH
jgi:hypothetical protein